MNVLSDFILRVEKNTTYGKNLENEIKDTAGKLLEKTADLTKQKVREASKRVKKSVDQSKKLKFDDIKQLSDTAIKKMLREVSIEDLSIALKDAETEVTEKILPNLGKRARKTYDELQQEMKKVSKKDIDKYRKEIEAKLAKLFQNRK
jgi:flagellar motor switch protein FliG